MRLASIDRDGRPRRPRRETERGALPMTHVPDPTSDSRGAGSAEDALSDPTMSRQLLDLVRGWMRISGEASGAKTEAAIDRGSFESFPASDPVASAIATAERAPSEECVDCTMTVDALTFRRSGTNDTQGSRPPPAYTLEADVPGGGSLTIRVWVDDVAPQAAVPEALELEPVHASIRPRQQERRVGDERRAEERNMPAGFDRRIAQRRSATGQTAGVNG
jgi:hypothetical protein